MFENNMLPEGATPLQELPLAMAYVPAQVWKNTYEPDVAISRGTLFPVLDLPFLGKEVR